MLIGNVFKFHINKKIEKHFSYFFLEITTKKIMLIAAVFAKNFNFELPFWRLFWCKSSFVHFPLFLFSGKEEWINLFNRSPKRGTQRRRQKNEIFFAVFRSPGEQWDE